MVVTGLNVKSCITVSVSVMVCCCGVVDTKVPVQFVFVSQETGSHSWKPWLKVHPSRGFIHIG